MWIKIFIMHGKIGSSLPYATVKMILISYISMYLVQSTKVFLTYWVFLDLLCC